MKKLCENLTRGDVITTADNKKHVVKSVSPGMLRGQKMIIFQDGEWSHAYPKEEIEITVTRS